MLSRFHVKESDKNVVFFSSEDAFQDVDTTCHSGQGGNSIRIMLLKVCKDFSFSNKKSETWE